MAEPTDAERLAQGVIVRALQASRHPIAQEAADALEQLFSPRVAELVYPRCGQCGSIAPHRHPRGVKRPVHHSLKDPDRITKIKLECPVCGLTRWWPVSYVLGPGLSAAERALEKKTEKSESNS